MEVENSISVKIDNSDKNSYMTCGLIRVNNITDIAVLTLINRHHLPTAWMVVSYA
jgi:hypothetical protein